MRVALAVLAAFTSFTTFSTADPSNDEGGTLGRSEKESIGGHKHGQATMMHGQRSTGEGSSESYVGLSMPGPAAVASGDIESISPMVTKEITSAADGEKCLDADDGQNAGNQASTDAVEFLSDVPPQGTLSTPLISPANKASASIIDSRPNYGVQVGPEHVTGPLASTAVHAESTNDEMIARKGRVPVAEQDEIETFVLAVTPPLAEAAQSRSRAGPTTDRSASKESTDSVGPLANNQKPLPVVDEPSSELMNRNMSEQGVSGQKELFRDVGDDASTPTEASGSAPSTTVRIEGGWIGPPTTEKLTEICLYFAVVGVGLFFVYLADHLFFADLFAALSRALRCRCCLLSRCCRCCHSCCRNCESNDVGAEINLDQQTEDFGRWGETPAAAAAPGKIRSAVRLALLLDRQEDGPPPTEGPLARYCDVGEPSEGDEHDDEGPSGDIDDQQGGRRGLAGGIPVDSTDAIIRWALHSNGRAVVGAAGAQNAAGASSRPAQVAPSVRRVDVVPVWQGQQLRVSLADRPESDALLLGSGCRSSGGRPAGTSTITSGRGGSVALCAGVRSLRRVDRGGRVLPRGQPKGISAREDGGSPGRCESVIRAAVEAVDVKDVLEIWHIPRDELDHVLLGEARGVCPGGDGDLPPTPGAKLGETARVSMWREKGRKELHDRQLVASRAGFMLLRWVRAVPRLSVEERWIKRRACLCICGLDLCGAIGACFGCCSSSSSATEQQENSEEEFRRRGGHRLVTLRKPVVTASGTSAAPDMSPVQPQHGLLRRSEVIDCLLLEAHPPRVALGRLEDEARAKASFESVAALRDAAAAAERELGGRSPHERSAAGSELLHLPSALMQYGRELTEGTGEQQPVLADSDHRRALAKRLNSADSRRPLVVPWRQAVWVGVEGYWPGNSSAWTPQRCDELLLEPIPTERPSDDGINGAKEERQLNYLTRLPSLPSVQASVRHSVCSQLRAQQTPRPAQPTGDGTQVDSRARYRPAGHAGTRLQEWGWQYVSYAFQEAATPWLSPALPGLYRVRLSMAPEWAGRGVSGWQAAHGNVDRLLLAVAPRVSLDGPLEALPGAADSASRLDAPPPTVLASTSASKVARELTIPSTSPVQASPLPRHWSGAPLRAWFATTTPVGADGRAGASEGARVPGNNNDRVVLLRLEGPKFGCRTEQDESQDGDEETFPCRAAVSEQEYALSRSTGSRRALMARLAARRVAQGFGPGEVGRPVGGPTDLSVDPLGCRETPPFLLPASYDCDQDTVDWTPDHWQARLRSEDALQESCTLGEACIPTVQLQDVRNAEANERRQQGEQDEDLRGAAPPMERTMSGGEASERRVGTIPLADGSLMVDPWGHGLLPAEADPAAGTATAPPAVAAYERVEQERTATHGVDPTRERLPMRTSAHRLANEAFDRRGCVLRPDGTGWVTFPGNMLEKPGLYVALYVCDLGADQHSVVLARSAVVRVVPPVVRLGPGLGCLPPPDMPVINLNTVQPGGGLAGAVGELASSALEPQLKSAMEAAEAVASGTQFGEAVPFRIRCSPSGPGTVRGAANGPEQNGGWVENKRHALCLFRVGGPQIAFAAAEASRRVALWSNAVVAGDDGALRQLSKVQSLANDAQEVLRAIWSPYGWTCGVGRSEDHRHAAQVGFTGIDWVGASGAHSQIQTGSPVHVSSVPIKVGRAESLVGDVDGVNSFSPDVLELSRAPRMADGLDRLASHAPWSGLGSGEGSGQKYACTVVNLFSARGVPLQPRCGPPPRRERGQNIDRLGVVSGVLGGSAAPSMPGLYRLGYAIERRRVSMLGSPLGVRSRRVLQLSLPFVVLGPYMRLFAAPSASIRGSQSSPDILDDGNAVVRPQLASDMPDPTTESQSGGRGFSGMGVQTAASLNAESLQIHWNEPISVVVWTSVHAMASANGTEGASRGRILREPDRQDEVRLVRCQRTPQATIMIPDDARAQARKGYALPLAPDVARSHALGGRSGLDDLDFDGDEAAAFDAEFRQGWMDPSTRAGCDLPIGTGKRLGSTAGGGGVSATTHGPRIPGRTPPRYEDLIPWRSRRAHRPVVFPVTNGAQRVDPAPIREGGVSACLEFSGKGRAPDLPGVWRFEYWGFPCKKQVGSGPVGDLPSRVAEDGAVEESDGRILMGWSAPMHVLGPELVLSKGVDLGSTRGAEKVAARGGGKCSREADSDCAATASTGVIVEVHSPLGKTGTGKRTAAAGGAQAKDFLAVAFLREGSDTKWDINLAAKRFFWCEASLDGKDKYSFVVQSDSESEADPQPRIPKQNGYYRLCYCAAGQGARTPAWLNRTIGSFGTSTGPYRVLQMSEPVCVQVDSDSGHASLEIQAPLRWDQRIRQELSFQGTNPANIGTLAALLRGGAGPQGQPWAVPPPARIESSQGQEPNESGSEQIVLTGARDGNGPTARQSHTEGLIESSTAYGRSAGALGLAGGRSERVGGGLAAAPHSPLTNPLPNYRDDSHLSGFSSDQPDIQALPEAGTVSPPQQSSLGATAPPVESVSSTPGRGESSPASPTSRHFEGPALSDVQPPPNGMQGSQPTPTPLPPHQPRSGLPRPIGAAISDAGSPPARPGRPPAGHRELAGRPPARPGRPPAGHRELAGRPPARPGRPPAGHHELAGRPPARPGRPPAGHHELAGRPPARPGRPPVRPGRPPARPGRAPGRPGRPPGGPGRPPRPAASGAGQSGGSDLLAAIRSRAGRPGPTAGSGAGKGGNSARAMEPALDRSLRVIHEQIMSSRGGMDAELGARAAKTKAKALIGACKHVSVAVFGEDAPQDASVRSGKKRIAQSWDAGISHLARDLLSGRLLELVRRRYSDRHGGPSSGAGTDAVLVVSRSQKTTAEVRALATGVVDATAAALPPTTMIQALSSAALAAVAKGDELSASSMLKGLSAPVRTLVLVAAAAGNGRFHRCLARTSKAVETIATVDQLRLAGNSLGLLAEVFKQGRPSGAASILLDLVRKDLPDDVRRRAAAAKELAEQVLPEGDTEILEAAIPMIPKKREWPKNKVTIFMAAVEHARTASEALAGLDSTTALSGVAQFRDIASSARDDLPAVSTGAVPACLLPPGVGMHTAGGVRDACKEFADRMDAIACDAESTVGALSRSLRNCFDEEIGAGAADRTDPIADSRRAQSLCLSILSAHEAVRATLLKRARQSRVGVRLTEAYEALERVERLEREQRLEVQRASLAEAVGGADDGSSRGGAAGGGGGGGGRRGHSRGGAGPSNPFAQQLKAAFDRVHARQPGLSGKRAGSRRDGRRATAAASPSSSVGGFGSDSD